MIENINSAIEDLVSDFLYYDRKEDEYLKLGDIEKAIEKGEITIEQIVSKFKERIIEVMQ